MERKSQGQMSEALFMNILEQLRAVDYRGRISYHFYNEPLLSPNLDRFVELTRAILPASWIEIYTNGTLLTEARLMKLLALGVDKFTITKHHGIKNFGFDEVFGKLSPAIQSKIKYQGYKELLLTSRGGLVRAGRPQVKPPLDLPCLIPSSLLVITVTGNVVPCFEDYTELNVMGNITEKPLLEIWNSERYQKFRADLKLKKRSAYPVCKDCNCTLIIQ
jgi:radical SAM protein with 4Fe4S-binding SPASM domain